MKQYEIIYIKQIDKLILYYKGKIAYEGTIKNILECGAKLIECRDADLDNITKCSEAAFKELNKLIAQNKEKEDIFVDDED